MDRQETISILAILKTAYPNFYRGMSRADAQAAADLWLDMFADDPAPLVGAAVKALIATDQKGYPPHIGAVRAKLRELSAPARETEAEAWARVRRAISRGIYYSEEEFQALPPLLRKLVGSPSQLRDWATQDSATVNSVVASNFQRSYRARAAQQEQWEALPGDVRALVQQLSDGRAMPELPPRAGRRPFEEKIEGSIDETAGPGV